MKQKGSFSVITRTAGNPATKVGKKLASNQSIAVHGAERLQGNPVRRIWYSCGWQPLLLLLLLFLPTKMGRNCDHLHLSVCAEDISKSILIHDYFLIFQNCVILRVYIFNFFPALAPRQNSMSALKLLFSRLIFLIVYSNLCAKLYSLT